MLNTIRTSSNVNAETTFETGALVQRWYSYETQLASFLMLKVYSVLRSASEYLQPKCLDILSAWNMVSFAKETLFKMEFDDVETKTKFFVQNVDRTNLK